MALNTSASIQIIGAEISSSGRASCVHYSRNQKIDIQKLGCIGFLTKGCVSVYRQSDSGLTLVHKAPAIIGLPQMRSDNKAHFHRFNENSEVVLLSFAESFRLFDEKKLWPHAFDILTVLIHEYFTLETMISSKDATNLILQHLKYIWKMDENVRLKTSLYTFILSRSHISRSAIQQIIRRLISEGKIEVSRGKLIKLTCP